MLSVSILSSAINLDFRVSHCPTTCHFLLCRAGRDRGSAGRPVTPHLSNSKHTKETRKDAGRQKETQRDAGRQMETERDGTRMHKQQRCHLRDSIVLSANTVTHLRHLIKSSFSRTGRCRNRRYFSECRCLSGHVPHTFYNVVAILSESF